jgi:hypothetical protein
MKNEKIKKKKSISDHPPSKLKVKTEMVRKKKKGREC